jgi:hypothetical protein
MNCGTPMGHLNSMLFKGSQTCNHTHKVLCTYPCNTNPKVPSQYMLIIFLTLVISLGQKWSQIVLRTNEIIEHMGERVYFLLFSFSFGKG